MKVVQTTDTKTRQLVEVAGDGGSYRARATVSATNHVSAGGDIISSTEGTPLLELAGRTLEGGMTRKDWEEAKRLGDAAFNEWEKRFGSNL